MAENSKIEWCEHTVNLWHGCAKVHKGCTNCYAETLSHRWGDSVWGEKAGRKRIKSSFPDLDKYQRRAFEAGIKDRVFVGSMMDIFEEPKQLNNPIQPSILTTNSLRKILFQKIIEGDYDHLIFLFLTKRPENIEKVIPDVWKSMIPSNVWFGTSLSDQETADIYVDRLRKIRTNHNFPFVNLFLSIEPQVGVINNLDLTHMNWVIQGGESGNKKRPFKLDWAYRMRDICKEQNTPYFFKQIDKVQPIPDDLMIRELPIF